jgi:hypothetical protein
MDARRFLYRCLSVFLTLVATTSFEKQLSSMDPKLVQSTNGGYYIAGALIPTCLLLWFAVWLWRRPGKTDPRPD